MDRQVLRLLSNNKSFESIIQLIEKHGIDLNNLVLEEKPFFLYIVCLCIGRPTYQPISFLVRAIQVKNRDFVRYYLMRPFVIDTYYGGTLPTIHAARIENYEIVKQLVVAGAQLPPDWQTRLNKISNSITCSKRMQNFKKIYDLYLAFSRFELSQDDTERYKQLASTENSVLFNRILYHLFVGGNRMKNPLFQEGLVRFNIDGFKTFIKKYDQSIYETFSLKSKDLIERTLVYRLMHKTEEDVLYRLLLCGVITITPSLIKRMQDEERQKKLRRLIVCTGASAFSWGYDIILKTRPSIF